MRNHRLLFLFLLLSFAVVLFGTNSGKFVGEAVNTIPTQTLTDLAGQNVFSDGFEDGTLSPFVGSWSTVSAEANIGLRSARSGAITHSQTSEMKLTLDVPSSGVIKFARKVSSEQSYDWLKFYIDGTEIDSWSGELGWENVQYPVAAGQHRFTWKYEKDEARSVGSDAVWIDDVSIDTFSDVGIATCPGSLGVSVGVAGNNVDICDPYKIVDLHFNAEHHNQPSSGLTEDVSIYDNHGVLNSVIPTTNGKYGSAYSFPCSYNECYHSKIHVNLGVDYGITSYFPDGSWTVMGWINPANDHTTFPPTEAGDSITFGRNALNSGWQIALTYDKKVVVRATNTGGWRMTGNTKIPVGAWTHLAVTRSGNNYAIYVNGNLEVSGSSPSAMDGSWWPLSIGDGLSFQGFFRGSIDEVKFYSTVLTQDRIRELMQSP